MKNRRIFVLLSILVLVLVASLHTTAEDDKVTGTWQVTERSTAQQYNCRLENTCVEWCYLDPTTNDLVPTGQLCCLPNTSLPSDDLGDCGAPPR